MSKLKELRSKSVDELRAEVTELQKDLFYLRFQKKMNQLKETHRLRECKKQVARVMTLLAEKINQQQAANAS